ncbi:MAG TPA: cupin domain-containing protein [Myxococcota bacterium]
MRIRLIVLTAVVALGAATVALAEDGAPVKAADKAAAPAKATAPAASFTPAADVKWQPFSPDPKGPMVSFISGDPKGTGPVEFFLKVPAGFKAGEHFHTNDYYGVVVTGTPSHGDDEKTAKTHTAGSTWFEPGKHNHYDACPGKEDCILVVSFPAGPVDSIPVGADGKPLPAGKK